MKKTSKNQLASPTATPDRAPSAVFFGVRLRGKEIVLKPVSIEASRARLRKVRAKVGALGLTEKDIEAAIRRSRSR